MCIMLFPEVKQKNSSLRDWERDGVTFAAGQLVFNEGQEDRQRIEQPQTAKQINSIPLNPPHIIVQFKWMSSSNTLQMTTFSS